MAALAALLVVGGIALTFSNLFEQGPPIQVTSWDGPILIALGIAAMFRALTKD